MEKVQLGQRERKRLQPLKAEADELSSACDRYIRHADSGFVQEEQRLRDLANTNVEDDEAGGFGAMAMNAADEVRDYLVPLAHIGAFLTVYGVFEWHILKLCRTIIVLRGKDSAEFSSRDRAGKKVCRAGTFLRKQVGIELPVFFSTNEEKYRSIRNAFAHSSGIIDADERRKVIDLAILTEERNQQANFNEDGFSIVPEGDDFRIVLQGHFNDKFVDEMKTCLEGIYGKLGLDALSES